MTGNSNGKILRSRLSGYDPDYRAEHFPFAVFRLYFVSDKGNGYCSRGMGVYDCPVRGFYIYFAMNPVLAGSPRRNRSFQRDKDRFRCNIEICPAPLDVKTIISMPYADIAEIPSNEVLSKEPFTNSFE